MTCSSTSRPRLSSIWTVVSPRSAPISTTLVTPAAFSTGAMATSHKGNMVRNAPRVLDGAALYQRRNKGSFLAVGALVWRPDLVPDPRRGHESTRYGPNMPRRVQKRCPVRMGPILT